MSVGDAILPALKGKRRLPPYLYPLIPAGWAYSAVQRVRAGMYSRDVLKRRELPCPVISIGNLAAGGTGKTPMAEFVCGLLREMGRAPAVLTRGYRGRAEGGTHIVSDGKSVIAGPETAGDEAVMLAERLDGVPVVMGADRYEAGMLALGEFDVDVCVLDDGFQHMRLRRGLDIVLLDAARPFGNGRILPVGYLREPKSALSRAGAVVLTRADDAGLTTIQNNINEITRIAPGLPVFEAVHRPDRLYTLWDDERFDMELIRDTSVFAFCGLGDPDSFALILNRLHVNIYGFMGLGDHYAYTQADLGRLEAMAASAGASSLITTEKDAVKLKRLKPSGMRIMVLGVDMALRANEKKFRDIVARSVG